MVKKKKITRDKGRIHSDKRVNILKDITIFNSFIPINITSKCMWQKLTEKGDVGKSITIKGYFKFSGIHRSRQNISRNIENMNNIIKQLKLIDIYKI